jgi:tetratricopeptide (TPR) repeat protein
MRMNLSEAVDIFQKEFPVLDNPIWIVAILIIIACLIIIIKKILERGADDIYESFKNKKNSIFGGKAKEIDARDIGPIPTTPPKPAAPCILSVSLPPRNPNFTGREDILAQLRTALTSGQIAAWKQALTGLGGTGKSQIAAEYAYRYQGDYRFIWWLQSEEPAALASNYAGLAQELELPEKSSSDQTATIAAVKRWLGENRNWVLIFDNVKAPEDIEAYLPREGTGHVVITSRNPNWGGSAGVLPIKVFKRSESVDFIIKRTKQESQEHADELANALGDLPLALEQAGAYMEERAVSLADYLKLFGERRPEVLERGKPTAYPKTIATTWDISLQAIKDDLPEATDLIKLFAFLAPDDIPRSLLIEGAQDLPEPLKSVMQDSIRLNDAVAALRRYSLINVADDMFSIHRLMQAVTQDSLDEDEKKRWAEAAVKLVNKAFPNDSDDVRTWPVCSSLIAHALASTKLAEELEVAPKETTRLLNQAGHYLRGRANLLEAEALYERALAIDEKVYGPDHNMVAIDVNNLGLVLSSLGDLQGAKKLYERALAIGEKAYGQDHPQVAIYVNNLGLVLSSLGDLQGAKKLYERALAIGEKAYGQDHPQVAIYVNNLGNVLDDLGDLQGAKKLYERALAIDEKVYGPDHNTVAIDVNNLGLVLSSLGDLQGAKKLYERALAIGEKVYGPDHPTVAIRVNNLGSVLDDLGELKEAKRYYERALGIFRKSLGDDHPKTKVVRNNLNLLEKKN